MTTLILGRTERDDAVAPGRPELDVRELPAEMVDWVDCYLCGTPNSTRQERCVTCGGLLRAGSNDPGQTPSTAPAVWLSRQFLDVGARHEIAQVLAGQV